MGTLVQCQPHFIRCIKPNPASQPGQLDPEYVLEQLRAGGVLEAVRIACAGFPTRKLFRYASIVSIRRAEPQDLLQICTWKEHPSDPHCLAATSTLRHS